MLIFIGLSYSIMRHSLSTLIVYFLVQSVASLVILIRYLSGTEPLFRAALLLKIAAFPFSFWFVYATSRLPVFIFFLVCTTQKLPPILLLSSFNMQVVPSFLWTSCIFRVLLSGAFILIRQDLRILLAASSIGTNG